MYVSTEYARVVCKECKQAFTIYPGKDFKAIECLCTKQADKPKARRGAKKDGD